MTRVGLAPGPPASVRLRRFSGGEFPVKLGDAPGGAVSVLRIPADRSDRPWQLRIDADQGARVCRG